jgi:hypothetical protein
VGIPFFFLAPKIINPTKIIIAIEPPVSEIVSVSRLELNYI